MAVYIKNVTNFNLLNNNFISILGTDSFTFITSKDFITINTPNYVSRKKIFNYISSSDMTSHTFMPRIISGVMKAFMSQLKKKKTILLYFLENRINDHYQLHREHIITFDPYILLQNTLGFKLTTKKKKGIL